MSMARSRCAKIFATLGPASSSRSMIRALFEAGANMFRLNFRHGSHADHQVPRTGPQCRFADRRFGKPQDSKKRMTLLCAAVSEPTISRSDRREAPARDCSSMAPSGVGATTCPARLVALICRARSVPPGAMMKSFNPPSTAGLQAERAHDELCFAS